jgi:hypothetical protein
MLKELLQGTAELADWRDDPDYMAAKRAADEAEQTVATLQARADELWKAAQAGREYGALPSPGSPAWPARERWIEADRGWEDAKNAVALAEADAKKRVQQAGEDAGRTKWAEAEADIFPRLIAWCREYAAVKAEVLAKTGVTLPDVNTSVCLTDDDLTTFLGNVRREFGFDR